ncbi:hypothetical protein SAZ10_33395 [Mesorhizobium sp. BAC0120]|uniref:hypothetical protein n=1 Tax=Mesorhizobium sp. BAC0120 TaxID=3090670 RepID=UPI00298BCB5E|nr:hypothetical protein [Mesorhizobium sp. BAC0120]MDW6026665.1 hypothetical protein [Mesorhizobium sp. BAC0120]
MSSAPLRDQLKFPIVKELYIAMRNLGAKPILLRIVGDYSGTLTHDNVLEQLCLWNMYPGAGGSPPEFADEETAIRHQLYLALVALEAPVELLGTIGSWGGDTLDGEVLADLRRWNATASISSMVPFTNQLLELTMADENETPRMTQREAQEALEKQVTQLKPDVRR